MSKDISIVVIIFYLTNCLSVTVNTPLTKKKLFSGEISGNNVRVRENPSIGAKILLSLSKGESVEVLSKTEWFETINDAHSSWFKIKLTSGIEGWVFGNYLSNFQNFPLSKYENVVTRYYTVSKDNFQATNRFATVTFKLPIIWSIDSSIINDHKQRKIGEFSPGALLLGRNRRFLYTSSDSENSKDLSIREISIANRGYKCVEVISETIAEDGTFNGVTTWYPHKYILEGKDKGFSIVFYFNSLQSVDRNLVKEILESIKIDEY